MSTTESVHPGQGQGPQPAPQPGPARPEDVRTMAMLAHLSTLLVMLVSTGFLGFIAPLVFWLVYRSRPGWELVRASAAGAFNVNVTLALVNLAAGLLSVVTLGLFLPVAFVVWGAVFVLALVLHVIAALRARRGELYRYPLQVPLLS